MSESFKPEDRVRLSFSDDANAERAPVSPIPRMSCEKAREKTRDFQQDKLNAGGMALLIHHCESENHSPDCPVVREESLLEELRQALRNYVENK